MRARVAGATGPFVYRWSDAGDAESLRVCPSETTRYTLDVSQAVSPALELVPEALRGAASIHVEVRDDCDEPNEPVPGSSCSFRIPVTPPGNSYPYLTGPALLDGRGNVYLAAQLNGKAHVADAVLGSRSTFGRANQDILLVKLDAHCQLLWYRLFSACQTERTLVDFAVDDAGNMALLTDDRRFEWLGKSYHHLHLSMLDPNGSLRWEREDPEEELGGWFREPFGLAFDSDGTVAVRGLRSLCDLQDAQTASWPHCLAAVDTNGQTRWTEMIDVWGAGLRFERGQLLVSGMAGPYGARLGMFSDFNGPLSYVARIDGQGTAEWLSTTAVSTETVTSVGHLAVHTADDEILHAFTELRTPGGMFVVARRVDLQGNPLLETATPLDPRATFPRNVRGLRDGRLLVATNYQTSQGEDVRSQAMLVWHDAAGNGVREQDVSEARSSRIDEVDVRDDGDVSLTLSELQDNGVYATALVIKVLRAR